jgi:hypothetical protein
MKKLFVLCIVILMSLVMLSGCFSGRRMCRKPKVYISNSSVVRMHRNRRTHHQHFRHQFNKRHRYHNRRNKIRLSRNRRYQRNR